MAETKEEFVKKLTTDFELHKYEVGQFSCEKLCEYLYDQDEVVSLIEDDVHIHNGELARLSEKIEKLENINQYLEDKLKRIIYDSLRKDNYYMAKLNSRLCICKLALVVLVFIVALLVVT